MSSNRSWELKIDQEIYKQLKKIPKKDTENIIQVIEALPVDPYGGDIEKIKGEQNVWRRRVGSFRVFYELIPRTRIINVFRLERRGSKTY